MSFEIVTKPEQYKWKVEGRRPSPKKPGHFEPFWFPVEFVMMGAKEFDEIMANPDLTDLERLRKIMPSWGLKGEGGQVIDISDDDKVNEVLNVPYMPLAIFRSYRNFITGGALGKN